MTVTCPVHWRGWRGVWTRPLDMCSIEKEKEENRFLIYKRWFIFLVSVSSSSFIHSLIRSFNKWNEFLNNYGCQAVTTKMSALDLRKLPVILCAVRFELGEDSRAGPALQCTGQAPSPQSQATVMASWICPLLAGIVLVCPHQDWGRALPKGIELRSQLYGGHKRGNPPSGSPGILPLPPPSIPWGFHGPRLWEAPVMPLSGMLGCEVISWVAWDSSQNWSLNLLWEICVFWLP